MCFGNCRKYTHKYYILEKMAAAGAEGGSIGSMSDTNIALSPADAAIIMYNTSNSKWEDNNVFGTDRTALRLDGGTF